MQCRCKCGVEKEVRLSELKDGKSLCCRSCSSKAKMAHSREADPEAFAAHMKRAAAARATMNGSKYTPEEKYAAILFAGAKQRCTNPESVAYKDYGGRGIKFYFSSIEEAARYMVEEHGARPSSAHSIDRIDNDRHYEPGNLRWATRGEQARNKRMYRGSVYGTRMTRLCAARPDYTYEGLRRYVLLGWSDEDIISMKKPSGGRPRKC